MRRAAAFTLVELVLVMALLCVIYALAMPSLSRSFHQRNLDQEAMRVLALTEYARDEAESQGVPMEVWIDTQAGRFGAKALDGYEDSGARSKEFTLVSGLHFEASEESSFGSAKPAAPGSTQTAAAQPVAPKDSAAPKSEDADEAEAVEFAPDGTLDPSSVQAVRIADDSQSSVEIAQNNGGSGYEIVKEGAQ
jgi:type II secretion system protein H